MTGLMFKSPHLMFKKKKKNNSSVNFYEVFVFKLMWVVGDRHSLDLGLRKALVMAKANVNKLLRHGEDKEIIR